MTNEQPAHFYMAPSSASRWIPCPGSLRACHGIPDDAGEAADRGSLGHHLVEIDLRGEPLEEPERSQLADMADADREELLEAVELCIELTAEMDGDVQLYETKIQSDVVEEHGGTIDVINYDSKTRVLHVVDYKFGRVQVDIEDNKQIKCYLNLARQMFPHSETFLGSIIQPAHSDRMNTVEFAKHELDDHLAAVVMASHSDHFEAGDHCTFCPALPKCQTAAEYLRDEIRSFPDLTQLVASVDIQPTEEDVDKLCRIYKTFKLAEKATEGAGTILKKWASEGANVKVHGLGLRVSYRAYWSNYAEAILKQMGIAPSDYLKDPTIVTPKDLRERLGLTKQQFEAKFEKALDLRPITSLVIGKASNDFPEFD